MIYNSFNFIIVFPFIFLLYYLIPSRLKVWRNIFLLIVSYLLYMSWNPVFSLVLLGVTGVTYSFARLMEKKAHRKLVLTIGLITTAFPLIFFKYTDFICKSISDMFAWMGLSTELHGLNWAIPLGISFFTFQGISYLCDVYYQRIEPERNVLVYALYLSFFPSIVSGPINRATSIIPQINNLRPFFDYNKAVEGLKMVLWGMFMKVVVADRVALYVDTVLPFYYNYTGMSCLLASFLYTIQIYADFAGYSLMAIGVGKLLGFELAENFRRPYFAVSVSEFWHRWHISLSTWLKDYVYIPMGGSRCSKGRSRWNVFVTFLVSGIWHGANWTFIVWGCMHGLCQIIEKMFGWQKHDGGNVMRAIRILITFLLVNFAWVFFRMPSLEEACKAIAHMFDPHQPMSIFLTTFLDFIFMFIGILMLFTKDFYDEFFPTKLQVLNSKHTIIRWSAYLFLISLIIVAGVLGNDQFIYANF